MPGNRNKSGTAEDICAFVSFNRDKGVFLHPKGIAEDEPLGEEGVQYITHRLPLIRICAIAEAILLIIQAILRFAKGL